MDIARISAKGGVALSVGMIVSNGIMALGTLLLANFLSTSEYGIYSVVFITPSFFTLFQDLGVGSAMIKYTSQYKSENRIEETKKILASGMLFNAIMGALLSLISFFLAGFLAVNVFQRPQIKNLIEIISILIFSSSIITASFSTFIGFERMEFESLLMIVQAILKGFFAPLLVLLGYGVFGAIVGALIASITIVILGTAFFFFFFYKKIKGKTSGPLLDLRCLGIMLRYGLPVSASTILNGSLTQFYNFMAAIYCNDILIANYQMAMNFMVLVNFVITPIAIVLFPAFSKINPEKDKETMKTVFQSSVKYGALLILPATIAVMVLSKPLVYTLFGEKFSYTPLYLSLLAFSGLYTGLGSLSIQNFIMGQGKTKVTFKLTLLTLSMGLPLSILLIPHFGIIGLIFTMLVAGIPNLIVGLLWIKRHYEVSIDKIPEAKIYISSGVTGSIVYMLIYRLSFSHWITLIIGGICFLFIYLILVSLIGAVNKNDVENIREMLKELGPLLKIVNPLFKSIEKLSSMAGHD